MSQEPKILGLTLHQPWAHWMATGVKRIENRDWPPPKWMVGRHIALHAGKTYDDDGAAFIAETFPELVPPATYEHGAVIAVAKIEAVITRRPPGWEQQLLASEPALRPEDLRWFFGAFGWLLVDAVQIEPVPCRGMQKLWNLPDPVLEQVRANWLRARTA